METFHPFEDDPRIYGDYLTEGVYLLFTQSTLPKAVNLANALARMDKVPGIVGVASSRRCDRIWRSSNPRSCRDRENPGGSAASCS
jgi:hypothetical protein